MRSWNSVALGIAYLLGGVLSLHGQTPTLLIPSSKPRKNQSTQKTSAPTAVSSVLPHGPGSMPTTAILAAGLPLRVQIDHRYRMRKGKPIEGRLIDPVYSADHIVLPVNTRIYGDISDLTPIHGSKRTWARLNGDFTPLKQPVLHFTSIKLPDGSSLPIDAEASERTADLVKMGPPVKKKSRIQKIKAAIHAKFTGMKQGISNAVHSKHKSERALQIFYGQLPYHPQDIWTGTEFDAELTQPVTLPDPNANHLLPVTPPHGHIPPGTIDVRLITPLTSKTDKVDTPVEAILTQPYLSKNHQDVILPNGTHLVGVVTQAKPARFWGRNGTLRFTFRQVKLPGGTMENVHAQMTAVEGNKGQNVTLDSEGGAHANADKGKYINPLVLGYLAGANALDTNQNQVDAATTSNGFGLPARILSILFVSGTTISVFAYYAAGQSVIRRWIMHGHEVVFAKNTRMELAVADR